MGEAKIGNLGGLAFSLPELNLADDVAVAIRRGRLVSHEHLLQTIGHLLTRGEKERLTEKPHEERMYFYMRPTESIRKDRESALAKFELAKLRFSSAWANSAARQGIGPPIERYEVICGDHLGFRFEVVRELSRGRFSVTVAAVDHAAVRLRNTKVAVQIQNRTSDAMRRFDRKLSLLTQLRDETVGDETDSDSSHLVHFSMYYETEDGWRCLVFRRNERTLFKSIFHGQAYPVGDTKAVMRGLLKALSYLHRLGIVHAGLTMHNVYIDSHEYSSDKTWNPTGNIHAVLGGFGNSRFEHCIRNLDGRSNDARKQPLVNNLTYLNAFGTRSPEVLLNYDGEIGYPSDIWSLGLMAAELVRGKAFVKFAYRSDDSFKDTQELTAIESQLGSIEDAMGGHARHMQLTRRHRSTFDSAKSVAKRNERECIFKDPKFKMPGQEMAIDFVSAMLAINPSVRKTAADLLQHGYLG